jgi:hypothetical protein
VQVSVKAEVALIAITFVPEVACDPLQPPLAVQEDASADDHVSVTLPPSEGRVAVEMLSVSVGAASCGLVVLPVVVVVTVVPVVRPPEPPPPPPVLLVLTVLVVGPVPVEVFVVPPVEEVLVLPLVPVFVATVVPEPPLLGSDAIIWFTIARVCGPTRPTVSR